MAPPPYNTAALLYVDSPNIKRPSSRFSEFDLVNSSQPVTPPSSLHSSKSSATGSDSDSEEHQLRQARTAKTEEPDDPKKTPPTQDTMSSEPVAPFHGDKDDENPEDFLRSFFRRMGTNGDDIKKQQFPNFLQADSVADEWFDDLKADDKSTWAKIETAFRTRWPRKKAVKKTNEEYEDEIRELTLKMEEVRKKEKVAGREVYTHIAWADKMATVV